MIQHVINSYVEGESKCCLIEKSENGEWLLMRGYNNEGIEIYEIIRILIDYDHRKKCYGHKEVGFGSGINLDGLPKEWLEKYHDELDLNNIERYHYPYKMGQLFYKDSTPLDLFAVCS